MLHLEGTHKNLVDRADHEAREHPLLATEHPVRNLGKGVLLAVMVHIAHVIAVLGDDALIFLVKLSLAMSKINGPRLNAARRQQALQPAMNTREHRIGSGHRGQRNANSARTCFCREDLCYGQSRLSLPLAHRSLNDHEAGLINCQRD